MTLRWPSTPHMLMSHVRLYPRIIVSNSHQYIKYVNTVPIFQKKKKKKKKNLHRSMIPRWPLTPLLLRSHVWLYPRIIALSPIKICQSIWIQWPFKNGTKGLWLHVCWGYMCDSSQGSLCLSPMGIHQFMWIQWSILQNTTYYILHTTYIHAYIHTNIHTKYRISENKILSVVFNFIFAVTIVSFWTQFRWDKKHRSRYYQKHKNEAQTNWYETQWTRLTQYDSRKWVNQLNCSLLFLVYRWDWVPSHLGICWPTNS